MARTSKKETEKLNNEDTVSESLNENTEQEDSAGDAEDSPEEDSAGDAEDSPEEDSAGDAEDSPEEDSAGDAEDNLEDAYKSLIALCPILYLSKQYKAGEILPANNPVMVQAWISAGSAKWMIPGGYHAAEGRLATAVPGLFGRANASETDTNLVGKITDSADGKR